MASQLFRSLLKMDVTLSNQECIDKECKVCPFMAQGIPYKDIWILAS